MLRFFQELVDLTWQAECEERRHSQEVEEQLGKSGYDFLVSLIFLANEPRRHRLRSRLAQPPGPGAERHCLHAPFVKL